MVQLPRLDTYLVELLTRDSSLSCLLTSHILRSLKILQNKIVSAISCSMRPVIIVSNTESFQELFYWPRAFHLDAIKQAMQITLTIWQRDGSDL